MLIPLDSAPLMGRLKRPLRVSPRYCAATIQIVAKKKGGIVLHGIYLTCDVCGTLMGQQ